MPTQGELPRFHYLGMHDPELKPGTSSKERRATATGAASNSLVQSTFQVSYDSKITFSKVQEITWQKFQQHHFKVQVQLIEGSESNGQSQLVMMIIGFL